MMKRFWRISMVVVLLAGFAALSFASPQAKKHKLTLENGKIIEGEIVAVTATTISIKDAALGVIAIARENILKIEPPLDETKPAVSAPAPAPRYADQPIAPRSGAGDIRFGFSLSGGMGNIDGGDFNKYILGQNNLVADYNDYWGEDFYTIDWKEMKWLPKFGGEVFARFGKYFGVGLGVEFISKSNPGAWEYGYDDTWTDYYSGFYRVFDDYYHSWYTIDQKLSVIPITLSFYGYLPMGPQAEAYVKAGLGYYLGTFTTDMTVDTEYIYNDNWYYNNGAEWDPHYHETGESTSLYTLDATCNTLGFHFGAGFNFNVSNNIAVFAEAFYRIVNFKDWQGTGTYDVEWVDRWGWTNFTHSNDLPATDSGSYSDSTTGRLWSYDDIWDYLDTGSYLTYWLYEAGNEPEEYSGWTENVRPTEFNLNGFTFKVGIKISFGGR
jgi:hypothetical protein